MEPNDMPTQASAMTAATSLLGTVTNAANAVSNVVNTASGGIQMLNNYVSMHLQQQELNNKFALDSAEEIAFLNAAKKITDKKHEMNEYRAENPTRAAIFDEEYARLKAKFGNETPTTENA